MGKCGLAVKGMSESARWQAPARTHDLQRSFNTLGVRASFRRSRWVLAQESSGRHVEIGSSYELDFLFVAVWFRLAC